MLPSGSLPSLADRAGLSKPGMASNCFRENLAPVASCEFRIEFGKA